MYTRFVEQFPTQHNDFLEKEYATLTYTLVRNKRKQIQRVHDCTHNY